MSNNLDQGMAASLGKSLAEINAMRKGSETRQQVFDRLASNLEKAENVANMEEAKIYGKSLREINDMRSGKKTRQNVFRNLRKKQIQAILDDYNLSKNPFINPNIFKDSTNYHIRKTLNSGGVPRTPSAIRRNQVQSILNEYNVDSGTTPSRFTESNGSYASNKLIRNTLNASGIRRKGPCRLDNMNDWRMIEDWVVDCAARQGIPFGAADTLNLADRLHGDFCQLADSAINEAGHGGGGGANDCLIHSLLSCLSPSFRKLANDSTRNRIANIFRRILLVDWVARGYIRADVDRPLLKTYEFLSDYLGNELCQKFNINILWCQNPHDVRLTDAAGRFLRVEPVVSKCDFTNSESDFTIGIHGDSSHFRPIELSYNGQVAYILDNRFKGQPWHNSCFPQHGAPACDFNTGSKVNYTVDPSSSYIVINRRVDPHTMKCSEYDILKISGKTEAGTIDDAHIMSSSSTVAFLANTDPRIVRNVVPATLSTAAPGGGFRRNRSRRNRKTLRKILRNHKTHRNTLRKPRCH